MPLTFHKPWMRYAFAVATVGLSTAAAALIFKTTQASVPYTIFCPAIIIAAIYAGSRAGLVAVMLASIVSPTVLKRRFTPFSIHSTADVVTLAVFVLIGLMLVWICRVARMARASAEVANESSRASELMSLARGQEFETVMKAVPAAILVAHDADCRVITGSPFTYQLAQLPEGVNLSHTPPTGDGPTNYAIQHPDGRAFTEKELPLQRAAKGEPQRQVRFDWKFTDGRVISFFGNAEPIFDPAGKPRGSIGAFVDVTSVVEADRAVRAAGERFRTMANSAPVLAWIDDDKKQCVWVSKPWLVFTGRTMEQELGDGWKVGVHPGDVDRCRENYNASVDARTTFSIEYRLRRHDGEHRWIIDRGVPLYEGPGGAFSGYIGSCIDITERHASEEQKAALLDAERAARMESERVGRMKDEFLATLSHELRTPLSAILGWSQLLALDGNDPQQVKQGLEAIARNARAQTQMIEDLLDMSRIISGKIRLNVQRVDLIDVVEAAIESTLPTANAKGVRMLKVLDPLAGPATGDPGRLQQVIWNLITNAIKFTPKDGKIEIVLSRVNSHIEVSVSDNGIGIKPEFLPFVFDRFRQDDGSTTRKHGGLGLGLSIVKQLVELHGGTVRASSRGEEMGTTFVVALPLAATRFHSDDEDRQHPTTSVSDSKYDAPKLNGVSVLIVDDDHDTRTLIERIFINCGADVIIASSAADGLDCVTQRRPNLVISDIGMPTVDGYEFIRRVRQLPPDAGGTTPAIALTAFARSEDRQRALMAGYQMHMAKPVEPVELVIACASLIGRPAAAGVNV